MGKRILCLFCFVLFLTGCRKEPMIHLSDENKTRLEIRRNENTTSSTETSDQTISDENNAEESSQSVAESSSESENSEKPKEPAVLDSSNWQVSSETPLLEVIDYLPSQMYQFKKFTDGTHERRVYPTYVDNELSLMQLALINDDSQEVQYYNWGTLQLVMIEASNDDPFVNQMETVAYQADGSTNELILDSPLQVGHQWERRAGITCEITQLFAEGTLPSGTYRNILEITVTDETQSQPTKEYYAEGAGLIATITPETTWVLNGDFPNNRIITEIPVYLPVRQDGSEILNPTYVEFKWQTNWTFAEAFQDVLRRAKIIDETIQVQSVTFDDDIVYIDFSPGIVSVLNSYDSSEQGIIDALVQTLGEFFQRNQVRISVDGNGMLPQEVEYPSNGIYYLKHPLTDQADQNDDEETSEEASQEEITENLELEDTTSNE